MKRLNRLPRWHRVIVVTVLSIWMPVAIAETATSDPEAVRLVEAGQLAYSHGQFDKAIDQWQRAVERFSKAGATEHRASTLERLAAAHIATGQLARARSELRIALTDVHIPTSPAHSARSLHALGMSFLHAGDLDEAQQAFESSLQEVRRSAPSDRRIEAAAENGLGTVFVARQLPRNALEHYRRSSRLAVAAGDLIAAGSAQINAARLLSSGSLMGNSDQPLAEAVRWIRAGADSHDKVIALLSAGQLYGSTAGTEPKAERLQAAYALYREADQLAQQLDDRLGKSFALGHLAELYLSNHQLQEARKLNNEALLLSQTLEAPELSYRWYWQSAKILRQLGEMSLAMSAYQHAIATLTPIRFDLLARYRTSGRSFRESIGDLYFEYADLLLQHAGQAKNSDTANQDMLDARNTIEHFKSVELEDYFRDDCVTQLQSRAKAIDTLAPRTAALYPIVLADRVELLLSSERGMTRVVSRIDRKSLTADVHALRSALETRTTREFLPKAQTLYDILIRPIAKTLTEDRVDTLILVPDDPLRTIPFAALHDGHDFLIRHYAVSTTPGLTITDPRPLKHAASRVLLNGLTESVQGFAPLPYVEEELGRIKGFYESEVLKDSDFRMTRLEGELSKRPFSIVHIASHGQFSRDSRDTFILAHDGKISMDRLERAMGFGRFRDDPIELLTLSACETAAGDDRAALGLAGIAVKAGARSALASLWYVNDSATADLIAEFYRQLRTANVSKAEALQRAQWRLLDDRRYRHPAYWAPFLLIGNWL